MYIYTARPRILLGYYIHILLYLGVSILVMSRGGIKYMLDNKCTGDRVETEEYHKRKRRIFRVDICTEVNYPFGVY